jgi:hypothetical protein
MISKSLVATALLMAACTPSRETPTTEPAPPPADTAAGATEQDTCGAARYRDLIGSNVDDSRLSASADLRILPPDSVVTQDFRPDRLNVIVDAEGRITGLECY